VPWERRVAWRAPAAGVGWLAAVRRAAPRGAAPGPTPARAPPAIRCTSQPPRPSSSGRSSSSSSGRAQQQGACPGAPGPAPNRPHPDPRAATPRSGLFKANSTLTGLRTDSSGVKWWTGSFSIGTAGWTAGGAGNYMEFQARRPGGPTPRPPPPSAAAAAARQPPPPEANGGRPPPPLPINPTCRLPTRHARKPTRSPTHPPNHPTNQPTALQPLPDRPPTAAVPHPGLRFHPPRRHPRGGRLHRLDGLWRP
jgi:hypothetical protein